jgi:DNA-directed RNA polymerase subunit RPC12/RpoP
MGDLPVLREGLTTGTDLAKAMSGFVTFFRHCPYCGRRFEIRLVSKKEATESDVVETEPPSIADGAALARGWYGSITGGRAVMEGTSPMLFMDEEFQYSYKCKHCGHEWSEVHETEKETKVEGYGGD